MADRSDDLRELLDLVSRLIDGGYSSSEVREMVEAVLGHLEGAGERPYALGQCVECGAVHVAWSEYQWSQVVRAPCRRCGKLW